MLQGVIDLGKKEHLEDPQVQFFFRIRSMTVVLSVVLPILAVSTVSYQ